MKYKYEYMSLTQLGKLFGTTSHQVGRWLAAIGLRYKAQTGLKASSEAHNGGFVREVGTGGGKYISAWHAERTVQALVRAGHKLCAHLGQSPTSEDGSAVTASKSEGS